MDEESSKIIIFVLYANTTIEILASNAANFLSEDRVERQFVQALWGLDLSPIVGDLIAAVNGLANNKHLFR